MSRFEKDKRMSGKILLRKEKRGKPGK